MPDATAELARASADIPLTRDAREILERATALASARASEQTSPVDVLLATLQFPRSRADQEMAALGLDAKTFAAQVAADGSGAAPLPLRQLLVNANREAQVMSHYQVDSIHLLLAMLYSDSPATAGPLQKAGVTLYELRSRLQTVSSANSLSSSAAAVAARGERSDRALRRRPWPSLRGVITISPVFIGLLAATAASGALLYFNLVPGFVGPLTIVFITAGWIVSLCIHEFGHAVVAYLGGDRSVAIADYLSLNPLKYTNVMMSLILPIIFLLLGGIALPGGAVYINHAALRTRRWSSAVSLAGPFGNFICGLLVAVPFLIPGHDTWITADNINFFAALAYLGFFQALAVMLNLLPVPGLDGFGIIRPWLPYSIQYAVARYGTVAIYGVFLVLWFVAPVRTAFFEAVFQIAAIEHIDAGLIFLGQMHMRFL